jgi:hypothetical protein
VSFRQILHIHLLLPSAILLKIIKLRITQQQLSKGFPALQDITLYLIASRRGNIMKALAALLLVSGTAAMADTQQEYSVDEFCQNQTFARVSVSQQQYLKAYKKKLGFKPSKEQCQEAKNLTMVSYQPNQKGWDYFQNKPYAGSAIRLSPSQIKHLRSLNVKESQLKDVLSSID